MPSEFMISTVRGLRSDSPGDSSLWARLAHRVALSRASQTFDVIKPHLKGKVLDIGVGAGSLLHLIRKNGFEVEGVDVVDKSMYEDIKPEIYNGTELPYKKNEFDTAVIALVLHHCIEPLKVLSEAMRVAKRVVIVEDTFSNDLEHRWLEVYDAILNFEFFKHKYHSVEEWKEIVGSNGWKLTAFSEWKQISFGFLYGRYCSMVIE